MLGAVGEQSQALGSLHLVSLGLPTPPPMAAFTLCPFTRITQLDSVLSSESS